MEKILLSHESYEILKKLSFYTAISGNDIDQFPPECIKQLSDYNLIECYMTDCDTSGEWMIPKSNEYSITELGKGYLAARQHEDEAFCSLKEIANSAKEQAESAKIRAELAMKAADEAQSSAKKAKREAFWSKVISVLAILVAFFQPFLSAYATKIVNTLSQLFSK